MCPTYVAASTVYLDKRKMGAEWGGLVEAVRLGGVGGGGVL